VLRGIAATLLIAVLGWAQPAMAQWLGGRIIGAPATTQRPDLRQAGPDYWTGYEAARAGDYRCAVEYYTRSLGAPGLRFEVRAAILNDRGVAYARIGDHERAVTDYDAALAITPGDG
jgi:hypothetical protein